MATQKSDKLLNQLSPATRKLLSQGRRRVDPDTIHELSADPCWWLIVIPDSGIPVITSYLNRSDFVAAVRQTLKPDLAHVFAFFGSRALLAPHEQFPQLVLPDGELVPLYDSLQQIAVSTSGEVGDEELRRLKEGHLGDGDEDEDAELDADQELSDQVEEAYAAAEEFAGPDEEQDPLGLP